MCVICYGTDGTGHGQRTGLRPSTGVLYATGPMGPVTGSVRVYAVYTDLRAEFLGHVSKVGAESGSMVDN